MQEHLENFAAAALNSGQSAPSSLQQAPSPEAPIRLRLQQSVKQIAPRTIPCADRKLERTLEKFFVQFIYITLFPGLQMPALTA